jgi:TatA/E family protein of Tat protein translocase
MFNLGMGEIALILILVLLFVGPKKLPDFASGLGKAIRQIRKATADVKNEIVLDDTFRKPFEELRDAVTLPAEELKRRDNLMAEVRRQVEEVGRAVQGIPPVDNQATPPPEPIAAEGSAPWPPPLAPPPAAVPPTGSGPVPPAAPPVGTFPRTPTPFPPGRLGGPARVTPPISSLSGNRANITQVLSEEDLMPAAATKGPPPPPPPLPGVAPPPPPGAKKG